MYSGSPELNYTKFRVSLNSKFRHAFIDKKSVFHFSVDRPCVGWVETVLSDVGFLRLRRINPTYENRCCLVPVEDRSKPNINIEMEIFQTD